MSTESSEAAEGFDAKHRPPVPKDAQVTTLTQLDSPMSGGVKPGTMSLERKRRGFEIAPIPLLAIRNDSEILEANEAATNWLDIRHHSKTPVHLERLLPETERAAFRLFVQELLLAPRIRRCELRFPGDGSLEDLSELMGIFSEENQEIWIAAIGHRHGRGAEDERLRPGDLFETIPAAIVLTDPVGRIQWVNRAFVEMTGYQLDEAIHRRPGEFLQGAGTNPATVLAMRDFLANKAPFEVEILNYHKNGTPYWVLITVNPIVNTRGDLIMFVAVQKNISKRKLAEFELARLETFNRTILENIPSLVAFWSRDLRCEFANREYRQFFGTSDETLLGKSMPEIVGSELFQQNEFYIRNALQGRIQGFERDIHTATGEKRSTWTQYVPRITAEQPDGFLVLITDVTHLKQTERALQDSNLRLRGILETMQTGLILSDLGGRVTEVNQAAVRILELTYDEIVGRTPLDPKWKCVREDGTPFPGAEHPPMVVLATGRPIQNVIMGLGMNDDSLKWVTINSSPLTGPDGLRGCVTIFSDITSFKQSEERSRRAKDAAEAASRAKSQFLAIMSHELRTPMNGLLGFAQLLKLTELTTEQRHYTDILERSGEALLALLNDILDMSRVEAGKLEMEFRMFDLSTVIQDVITLNSHNAREKNLKLFLDCPLESHVQVIADPRRVRQVLLNLVGNALKFTHRGEISIAVTPGEPGFARISIVDTGIGIPPEKQHLLFQPFSQVDASTTRKYGGCGLGLALCKELVGLMGGRIGCTSGVDRGSTFWFTLPQCPAEGR